MSSKTTARSITNAPVPRRTTAKKENADNGAIFSKKTWQAYLFTLAVGGCLILLTSLAAYFHPDPNTVIPLLGYLCAGLTALAGGWYAGKLRGNAPAIWGPVNGILLTVTMLLLSLGFLSRSSNYSASVSTLLHVAVPILSFLGALLGTKKSHSNPRRARKR